MSMEEKNRKPRHVKKGKDMRRHVKDRDDYRVAKKEMFEHRTR
jgi:hypothetical protein